MLQDLGLASGMVWMRSFLLLRVECLGIMDVSGRRGWERGDAGSVWNRRQHGSSCERDKERSDRRLAAWQFGLARGMRGAENGPSRCAQRPEDPQPGAGGGGARRAGGGRGASGPPWTVVCSEERRGRESERASSQAGVRGGVGAVKVGVERPGGGLRGVAGKEEAGMMQVLPLLFTKIRRQIT